MVAKVEGAALFCWNPTGGANGTGAFEPVLLNGGSASVYEAPRSPVVIHHGDVNEIAIPVATFYVAGKTRIGIQMQVETNALDTFQIRFKYSPDGEWITRASAAVDWTTPSAPILAASGSFVTAAVGSAHFMSIDVSGAYAVQLWAASSNAAGSKTTCHGVCS